ncbi:hypothetical protein [Desertivirga arenae]|uniref:hypothetical protein n=1 Tax=Desertivirga arenae TaxID=2810309 RepID=UPI001A9741DC|nr:hypothetical protein [Pedobacter sp. SYSU D00823]
MNLLRLSTAIVIFSSINFSAKAQTPVAGSSQPAQPFLFITNTMNSEQPRHTISYAGGVGARTEGPFGYDGVNQQAALNTYLGHRFTFIANMGLGFANGGRTQTAQQAEVIRNFIGGKTGRGPALGIGLGISRDWSNVKSALSRITLAYTSPALRLSGNMLFEKPFASNRDKVDFTTSLGFQHRIKGNFFAGVETIGEDLEGFWEKDEAEGGAKMLVGPSLNYRPSGSRLSFSACGGPVFYATKSTAFGSGAMREIGRSVQNGYSVRAALNFSLR